jgi:hypothetical protein
LKPVATEREDRIDIRCAAERLYDYVTQPWHWHEWHPNSISAGTVSGLLRIGDTFDEVIELQPLSPLPFHMRRNTHYRVVAAEPPGTWEVEGRTRDGWLKIRYELQPGVHGTRFIRRLTYQTQGLSRLLMPLLKRRVAAASQAALVNLKTRMEQHAGMVR